MKEVIEQIKGLPISDTTARLIACHRFTDDVYDNIMRSLKEMYGEYEGEEIMETKCFKLFNEVEGVIRELISESISCNIEKKRMKSI